MSTLTPKTKPIGWSIWKLCMICWWFSVFFIDLAKGGFSDPLLVAADNPIEGVEVNDNGIEVTVKENVGAGLADGFIIAKVMLTEPGNVSLLAGAGNFSVEPGNDERSYWNLRQAYSQDFERLGAATMFYLVIENPPNPGFTVLSVIIEDVNDEIPRFDRTEPDPILPIKERQFNPDEELFKVIALDNDVEDMRLGLVYTVEEEGSGGSVPFRINDQGGVFLTESLDYLTKTSYRLSFTFKDQREPIHVSRHSLTIQVEDVPNRPPEFTRPPTVRSVKEGSLAVGETLFNVEARDGDYGLDWDITYELIDANTPKLFEITNAGEVKVLREIDAEEQALLDVELLYSFKIVAKEIYDENEYEGLTPEETESEIEVMIAIEDINDNPPTLCNAEGQDCKNSSSYSFTIPEDHTGQVLDEALRVRDIDSTTKYIRFTATFADTTPQKIIDAFSISPSQGIGEEEFQLVVKNVAALDFEDEFWHDENNDPKPVSFEIEIKSLDESHPEHLATATITATVTDVNDNTPTFQFESEGQTQYEFMICENTRPGDTLKNIIPSAETPDACKGSTEGVDIEVFAMDLDITQAFGQESVVYRWSSSSRTPPIDVDSKTGKMTMNDLGNFDYERFKEEIFVLEAADSGGEGNFLSNTVLISFKILDVNDVPVDLRIETTRKEILEDTQFTEPVLEGITVTDVDVTANIQITMSVINTFIRATDSHENVTTWSEINGLAEDIDYWFELDIVSELSNDTYKVARIILGDKLPDREGYGEKDVDRVDLLITATDENTEANEKSVSQVVTITLKDINDNPPTWPIGENYTNHRIEYLEDEPWDEEEGDQSSDSEREIFKLRVIDPDNDTTFKFSKSNPECRQKLNDSMCDQILELIEIVVPNDKIGSADLRRVKGKLIDREQREYFDEDSDILEYLITVSDGENELESKLSISVGDRNDNSPIFKEMYNETTYDIDELVSTEEEIIRIIATDEDHPVRYGNVSYLIVDDGAEGDDNNGMGKFKISIQGGVLTAVPGAYNWNITKEYRVQIKAVDYYRPSQSSGSNPTVMFLNIRVNDKNNNRPEFLTIQGGIDNPLVEIKERDPVPDRPFDETIILRDWDNSELDNGKVIVKILKVVKEKDGEEIEDPEFMELFKLGSLVENKAEYQWELPIIPTRNFTGLWGFYIITLEASNGVESDPTQPPCEAKYVINILNENLNAPEFTYPEGNSTSIYLSIADSGESERLVDLKTNQSVPDVLATDPDDGENGIVLYDLENHDEAIDCRDHFQIHPSNGRITLKQRFTSDDAGNHCLLLIKAYDRGDEPKANYRTLDFLPLTEFNTPPAFSSATWNVQISENDTEAYANVSLATDLDIETENPLWDEDVIFYFIKGGAIDVFDLEEIESEDENGRLIRIPSLKPKEVLDREEIEEYKVTIYATNNNQGEEVDIVNPEDVDPNNKQFLVVNVEVTDVKDTVPAFATEEIITGGFSMIRKTDEIITIVSVIDPDLEDPVSFEITSGFTPSDPSLPTTLAPFSLATTYNNTVEIVLKFDPQPNYKGHYRFQITAKDTVGFSASSLCQMYMVTNENILKFYFVNAREFFTQERQTSLAKILSDSFSTRCNIDRVIADTTGVGTTVVETHFIDLSKNEPVASSYIKDQQYKLDVYTNLTTQLNNEGFNLAPFGIGGPSADPDTDKDQLIIYILMAGVAVLVVMLLIISASCFYNNRGLSRRVRALTATAFGSQKSDLNRLGVAMDAPNTNEFAIEGSNPVWTIDTEPKRFPDFDAESVGSGGSVLIGAEDEDYFRSSSKNPMFQAEDVVANYGSDNDMSDGRSYGQYDNEPSYYNQKSDLGDNNNAPFASRTTRNPLMDLGKSIDVDETEPYEPDETFYEGNADDAAMF